MAISGASHHFVDGDANKGPLASEKLNSLDFGGNVYPNSTGGLKVDVSAINGVIDGLEINYAGVSGLTLTGSATNYIYIDDAGALQVSTSSFPTYASNKYFPLAEVLCGSAAITTITDKRWRFFLT